MLLIALTVWLGIPTYFTWKALSGEPATAYVERCDERTGETVCYGTWRTETGQPGSGRIDGAFSSDVGAERRVWVTGDSATTTPPWSWWIPVGLWGVATAVGMVLVIRAIIDRRHGKQPKPPYVIDWEPPAAFESPDRPSLYACPEVVITRRRDLTAVTYELTTRDGASLGTCQEPSVPVTRRIRRFLGYGLGSGRLRLVCTADDGAFLFTIDVEQSPWGWMGLESAWVYGKDELVLGSIERVNRNPLHPRLLVRATDDSELARVQRSSWGTGSYQVIDRSGVEVARLVDPTTATSMGVSGYRWILQFRRQPDEPLHTLLLALIPATHLLTDEY